MSRKYKELLKLKGKMTEEKETVTSLADKLGMSRKTLTNKLEGKTAFDILEIRRTCEILGIDRGEVVKYFFTDWSHNAK